MVTSTGSGLSVPDWPNTWGYFLWTFPFSQWVGGIFYEHLHRLIASVVGVLTIILTIWVSRSLVPRRLKRLSYLAFALVCVQGILGGITVLFYLPTAVSMLHGITAQTFLCLTIAISYFLSDEWINGVNKNEHAIVKKFYRYSLLTTTLIFIQLVLGAWMRHTESGLAVTDFPTLAGNWFPIVNEKVLHIVNAERFQLGLNPVTSFQVWIHVFHRLGGFLVGIGIISLFIIVVKNLREGRTFLFLSTILLFLFIAQLFLAGFVIWSVRDPIITTFHVWTGASILSLSLLLTLRCYRFRVNRI